MRKIKKISVVLLAVLMLFSSPRLLLREARAVTPAEIDALKREAAQLDEKKKSLSKQLAALEGEINTVYARKLTVEQEINVVESQIATAEALLAKYDEQIAQETANLAEAVKREEEHFETFCQRVRIMEEQGTASYWQVLFGATDFTDLLDRAMMINEVVEYDNAVLASLEQARMDVEESKTTLEFARAEQVSVVASLDTYRSELDAKRETVKSLLSELQIKQDTYQEQLNDLDRQILAMDDEIAAKQKEYERQIAAGKIQINTGSGYIWPLDGWYTLTSLFGNRIHPISHLPNYHLGIDIRASHGSPIKAARGGVVSKSTYGSSYGEYVILTHSSSGDSTRYAHMSSRAVSAGQVVKQGDIIGYVGSTGSSTGNHLHFEVFINGVRVDPVEQYPRLDLWTTYKGKTVKLEH